MVLYGIYEPSPPMSKTSLALNQSERRRLIIGAGLYFVLIEWEWSESGTQSTGEVMEAKETV